MEGKRESFKYTSIVGKKLILFCFIIFILFGLPQLLIIRSTLSFSWFKAILAAIFIVISPCLSYAAFCLFNLLKSGDFRDRLPYCKYHPIFPFYFYTDKKTRKESRIKLKEIKEIIRPCDVVLRRYNNYLDGLIFSQNSYFTHVGIFYKDAQNNDMVLHSEGEKGVHMTSLKDFLNCDDTAILRFSFDKMHNEFNVRQHIINAKAKKARDEVYTLKQNELKIFDDLIETVSPKLTQGVQQFDYLFEKEFSPIVLERALSLLGTPYDFKFNFDNFNSLSCIEYVWYCFKCLYPIHQIKVKDFEYFQFVRLPVILPDVFVKNKHFRHVYTSLKDIHSKKQLKKYIKKGTHQFRWFLVSIFIWETIITGLLYCSLKIHQIGNHAAYLYFKSLFHFFYHDS